MINDIKSIDEEIKRLRVVLQTLDIQFKNSPYNKQPENTLRKKEALLMEIEKLKQIRNEKLSQ
ncbi:hypothetical protein PBV87_05505 [Niameybacter massiliensis]|uniref:Uncharacterized protein n=1 Tax=Holtiella tumoricola TaxID=3018743 RepID=A0AA42J016_9FIRM|nr:hypothetical protein [Holtiella tumoricola]MDA3730955.1 hypothetical protein [Holtiella tumoricola]